MAMTKDSFISTNTANYLASYSGGKTPEEIAEEILGMINNDFDMYNAAAAKGRKLKCMDKLLPVQIADIILALHNVAAIKIADTEDGYILAMYQEDGENDGIYTEPCNNIFHPFTDCFIWDSETHDCFVIHGA